MIDGIKKVLSVSDWLIMHPFSIVKQSKQNMYHKQTWGIIPMNAISKAISLTSSWCDPLENILVLFITISDHYKYFANVQD